MKKERKLIGAGFLTAFTASLCCTTPVLALISGTGGIASTFSWIEPFRPYLIGLAVVMLGLAWYLKLKPKTDVDCDCPVTDKPGFFHGKTFLGLLTLLAVLMLAFPYYVHVFFPQPKEEVKVVADANIRNVEFTIKGMTCASCEEHVNYEVHKLPGIINSAASYEKGNAFVEYDPSKTSEAEIEQAINATGYIVTDKK
ncbi:mercuric transport protein MerTP [Robiginitalea sediminis]|uniref:mercuric transport protein MerTP n=1 Tax=Robiginitalea sediminis TaxID=1982593 RepID=UPI000B4C0651|nr:mercuric transport protein MerTP [Robiginitalea sediminis]